MRKYISYNEAIRKLSPEQFRVTAKRYGSARHRRVSEQQRNRASTSILYPRAAVRLVREIRLRVRVAELHQAR